MQNSPEAPKTVAIYIRVSTLDQAREGYSLAAQERTLRGFCEAKKYNVFGVYADEGISAKDIEHRPAMLRMLDDAAHYDIICVWSLSRFTRSVSDLYAVTEALARKHVDVVSVTESFDTSTAVGRAMRGLMGVFSQMEREITAERVALALEERVVRGLPNCAYILGYDRQGGAFTINESEAHIVRHIFALYIDLQNIRSVSKACNRLGYRGKHGGKMKCENVRKILTRFFYCGYNSWKRTPYQGAHPPIIDIATYNRVQTLMEERGACMGRTRIYPLVHLPTQE